jgi:hypothetical protein
MKTFRDFITEAKKKITFSDIYANKVSKLRDKQISNLNRKKANIFNHPTHKAIQKIKDQEEHDNYVKSIRDKVKKEYGIEDED